MSTFLRYLKKSKCHAFQALNLSSKDIVAAKAQMHSQGMLQADIFIYLSNIIAIVIYITMSN